MSAHRVYLEFNRRGFVQIIIVAIIALVIGAVAIFGYQKYVQKPVPSPTPTSSNTTQTQITSKTSPSPVASDETVYTDPGSANWKTYTNIKYKYSFQYPNDVEVVTGDETLPENVIIVTSTKQGGKYFGLDVKSYSGSILTFQKDLEDKNVKPISSITVSGKLALSYFWSGIRIVQVFNNGYEYQISINDEIAANQILSTFKFTN